MTDKPIKATLDSSDDSVKTQKPILIQLDDIPTPTSEDAGKVLGVDENGTYALTEGGGGGSLYMHCCYIRYYKSDYNIHLNFSIISSNSTAMSLTDIAAFLHNAGYTSISDQGQQGGYPCGGSMSRDGNWGSIIGLLSVDGTSTITVFFDQDVDQEGWRQMAISDIIATNFYDKVLPIS